MQNLQEMHIEGLKAGQDFTLQDDTPPEGVQVSFSVVSETVRNQETKLPERKNFVYYNYSYELGRSSGRRRIRDKVKFNEATGEWEVLELARKGSDILRFRNEWNAFFRGVSVETLGTPLDILFPNDPSRVAFYKTHQVHSIERLSGLPEHDLANLGMGAREDQQKAKRYRERLQAAAPSIALEAAMTEMRKENETMRRENESLKEQLLDLSDKLTQVLQAQIAAVTEQPDTSTEETKAKSKSKQSSANA